MFHCRRIRSMRRFQSDGFALPRCASARWATISSICRSSSSTCRVTASMSWREGSPNRSIWLCHWSGACGEAARTGLGRRAPGVTRKTRDVHAPLVAPARGRLRHSCVKAARTTRRSPGGAHRTIEAARTRPPRRRRRGPSARAGWPPPRAAAAWPRDRGAGPARRAGTRDTSGDMGTRDRGARPHPRRASRARRFRAAGRRRFERPCAAPREVRSTRGVNAAMVQWITRCGKAPWWRNQTGSAARGGARPHARLGGRELRDARRRACTEALGSQLRCGTPRPRHRNDAHPPRRGADP